MDATTEIGIVVYPGAQPAAVHGLTDLLGIAGRFATEARPAGPPPLRVTHWALGQDGMSHIHRGDAEADAPASPHILVLPPTLASPPDAESCARIAQWLRRHHARGALLVSICSGAYLLAATGLVDARTVSTHCHCAQALAEHFPQVAVDTETRIIDLADILTAGGFMAWVDLGLILVERLFGPAVQAETARFVGSHGGALAELLPRQAYADPAVRKAQEFIHLRDGQGISLTQLASVARLGHRTLLRRFRTATGMTPGDYSQTVRLARAREMVEAGAMPLKEIARSLGYGDPSAFARAFRRAHGQAPGAFRKKQAGAKG